LCRNLCSGRGAQFLHSLNDCGRLFILTRRDTTQYFPA
jgi:hypothetical protein